MPLQLEIIRATEFVRVGAEGQFDLAASKVALATVARACRKRGVQHAVMDLRALQPGPKPVFTRADLTALVNTFPAAGFTRQLRLAILYRSDPHRRARLFAFLSTLHGWNVRAFGEFATALDWLSAEETTSPPPRRAAPAEAFAVPVMRAMGKTPRRTVSRFEAAGNAGGRKGAGLAAARSPVTARSRGSAYPPLAR
jgi:hypothetical protein